MFGFHFAYILVTLFVLALVAAAVVGVVLLATRSATGSPRPAPPTQLSPDGKWWWDGHEWKPVQTPPTPPPAS